MFKKTLLAASLMIASVTAQADWVGGVSYSRVSDDDAGISVDLGTIGGTLGYVVNPGSDFLFIPEFRVGFGVSDDSMVIATVPVEAKIKTYYGATLRGQFQANDSVYLYVAPSYINYDLEVTAGGITASADDWEFGIGAGVGVKFMDNIGAELSYESVDSADVISLGLRFTF